MGRRRAWSSLWRVQKCRKRNNYTCVIYSAPLHISLSRLRPFRLLLHSALSLAQYPGLSGAMLAAALDSNVVAISLQDWGRTSGRRWYSTNRECSISESYVPSIGFVKTFSAAMRIDPWFLLHLLSRKPYLNDCKDFINVHPAATSSRCIIMGSVYTVDAARSDNTM